MNKAAVALGLAGFAAAGAISMLTQAPNAPARQARTQTAQCSAGSHAGQAIQKSAFLKINGRRPTTTTPFLKGGDRIGTTSLGTATVCLRAGSARCELAAGTDIRLLPSPGALASLNAGRITCSTKRKRKQWDFVTKAQTIKLGALGLPKEARHGLGVSVGNGQAAVGGDHLFSISIQANKTTVKVRRGLTVVADRNNLKNGVVVGRDKQVTAVATEDPNQPSAIQLTAKERRVFANLQASLPPLRDTTPPRTQIIRAPRKLSSTRLPRFEFDASESPAVFSCSLDGGVFRICSGSQRFETLDPGIHRLAVAATDSSGNLGRPIVYEWTTDSSMIVFTSERDGNREIYSMDPDGRNQRNLTNNRAVDSAPVWSPDGRLIAFHTDRDRNFEIYVMNADGTKLRRLTRDPAFDLNPTWSPDGKQLAFESARDGNSELYVMTADGTDVRRLTNDPAADFDPAWSPDGTRIAFASRRRGDNNDIYVMNADGTKQTILDADPHVEYNPAWSPDSRQIAFHSDREGGSSQIWLINADGTGLKRLTRTSASTGASDYNPVWAPDGATLAFQSNLHGDDDIYIIGADGTDLTQLTSDPAADIAPDW